MPTISNVGRAFLHRGIAVIVGGLAVVLAMWMIVVERARYEEHKAGEDARRVAQNLALAFEQQTVRQLQSIDQLVLFVRHERQAQGDRIDLREVLNSSVIERSAIRYIAVVDRRGVLAFSSNSRPGLDLSDRDYFRAHRAEAHDRLLISQPTAARTDGRSVIHFSRRMSGQDGEFRGVVLVGIAADYLAQGSSHFDIGERGQLILLGWDGIARARRVGPKLRADVDMSDSNLLARARTAPAGSYLSRGRHDGVPRYMAYRVLSDYALIAALGVPADEALAAVRGRARAYYAGAAGGTAAALLLVAALLLALRRQKRDAVRGVAAEAAATESERRFRQLAENIREVFWLTDPTKNQMLYISPAYEAIWGRSCESLYASPRQWIDAIHPEDRERVLHAALEKQASGKYVEEYRIVRSDGSVRWIRDRAFPIVRDGQTYRVAGLAEDITESRRIADELRESVARHRATFEQAAVGVAHTTLDGKFLNANRRLCEMLRYTEGELQGRDFGDVTHPEDVAASDNILRRLLDDRRNTVLPHFEKRYLRKDGTSMWAYVSPAVVRDERGVALYFVTMVQDITGQKEAQVALLESQAQFQQLAENIPEAFWITGVVPRRVIYESPAFEIITGQPRGPLERAWSDWKALFHPDDGERACAAYLQMDQKPVELEHRLVRGDGAVRWVRARGFPVRDAQGAVYRVAGTVEDITERKAAEEAIRQAEARYRATFDQAAVGVAHNSLDGVFVRVNGKLAAMLGYEPEELVGRNVAALTYAADQHITDEARRHLVQHPEDSMIPEYEKRYLRKDGSILWASVAVSVVRDASGAPEYVIALVKDITGRKQAEEKLIRQAHYDGLTDLPNRTLFYDRLTQALSQAWRHEWTVGIMTLDLDRFNTINDTLGHERGDWLLCQVAKRLSQCVRAGDTVARTGGDEFGIIAADLSQPQDAGLIARKMTEALALPFDIDGQEVFVSASAGIATFPLDGRDGSALIKNADAAMFRAKQMGRNNFQFYTAEMNERAIDKLRLETDLRRAMERNEFRLHFQPKVALRGGGATGFEALLRWQRPGSGLVSPAQFVPLLEDTGLIVPVGDWVIRAVCAQIVEWRRAGFQAVPVALNLSAKQFVHRDIAAVIDAALREYAVPGELLEVEITESDAMQNAEATMQMLGALKARGVRIAIDDFGTGYSSLSYLKRFPVDTLKLDRSFVQGLPDDADDASIARAVITMAHSLGLDVVAEGVETPGQRHFLASEGCDQMQGYLLSRPVPAEQCQAFLAAGEKALA